MNFPRFFRLAMVALIPAAAISLGIAAALAQSPPPAPPAASTPAPATPAPAPSVTPVPPPAETKSPADSPSTAQTPPSPPAAAPVQTADAFGEEITLAPKTVVIIKGNANWDSAFDTLIDSFKALSALLDKQGIKLAEVPVDQEPKNLTKAMSMGKSPEGKALKFVHRGSYDNMDNTYEAITNHLDDKKLEAKDTFVEEYIADPLKTAEDKLVINVYVPLK
jgi:effector-binding domain-containing protein